MNLNDTTATIIERANRLLESKEPFATKEFKEELCIKLEKILRKSRLSTRYKFLDSSNNEKGTKGYFERKYF